MSRAKMGFKFPPNMLEESEFLTPEVMKEASNLPGKYLITLFDGKKHFLAKRQEWLDYVGFRDSVKGKK